MSQTQLAMWAASSASAWRFSAKTSWALAMLPLRSFSLSANRLDASAATPVGAAGRVIVGEAPVGRRIEDLHDVAVGRDRVRAERDLGGRLGEVDPVP